MKVGLPWRIFEYLTGFTGLRKIDITNKEVPKSAFFVSLEPIFSVKFLSKEMFLSGEGGVSFRKSALTITCLFQSDDLHPGLRKGVTLF